MNKIISYYGGGNTARGFKPLYDSILKGLDLIYSLNGGSTIYKTSILKKLVDKYDNVEIINSSLDNDELEGIILRDLNIAIVNGTPIHEANISSHGVKLINIDLDKALDNIEISSHIDNILNLKKEYLSYLEKSYNEFSKALEIHDDWEKLYINNLNFEKANNLTDNIINKFLENNKVKDKNGLVYDRYLGAATPEGSKDFVPNITEGIKRYFLKGRPGTGKSTLLKKIAEATMKNGYDIEVYHCGFDPTSIDMVICRELNFAIFDSTSPHEYFPEKKDDIIIDVYKEYVKEGTDEKHEKEITEIAKKYKSQVKVGVEFLAKGKLIKDKIEKIYDEAFDYNKGDLITQSILNF